MAFNIISCAGYETGTAMGDAVGVASSGCIGARLGLVILFFLIAIIRKWGAEEWDIDFSFWLAMGAGIISYIVAVTFLGSMKIPMVVGILAACVVGYGAGYFMGEGGEDGY